MEGICKPATQPQTPFEEEEVWFSNASTAKGFLLSSRPWLPKMNYNNLHLIKR